MENTQPRYGKGSLSVQDIERQESSLDPMLSSSSGSHEVNSADFDIPEPSPSKDWKLPPLKPEEVYNNVKRFGLVATTSIKIKESCLQCDANLNKMMKIPLLSKSDLDKAKAKGYQFMHLGCVKIGINPLHRSAHPTFGFSALFDNRWTTFSQALLGGVEAPLSHGPVIYDVRPNFAVLLNDPHILDCLQLGIQTSGYENFKSKALNLAIFYSTCVWFTNTLIPAAINADKSVVTMMTYDEGLVPTAPQQIPCCALCLPDDWVTSWGSSGHRPTQSIDQSTIREDGSGTAITRFPRPHLSHQSSSAQRGGPC